MNLGKLFSRKPWRARARAAMSLANRGVASLRSPPRARAAFNAEHDAATSRYPFATRLRAILPLLLAGAFFAAVASIGASHVTLKLRELDAGHQLGELHKERAELEKEHRRLSVELGTLKNPERIRRIAKERLGLSEPKPSQLWTVPR